MDNIIEQKERTESKKMTESTCIISEPISELLSEEPKSLMTDNKGIGVVEIILILVVIIGLVLIFRNQITSIVTDALNAVTENSDVIIN